MEDQFLNEILKDTYTFDSFKVRVIALKHLLEDKLYKQQGSKSPKPEETWLKNFDEQILKTVTSESFSSVFKAIDEFINQIKPLTIYFVFIPDQDQIQEIGTWLRKNLNNPKLIFNVKTDSLLIGGCAIAYKGVYKDLSLRARIHEKRELIIGQFKNYLRG